MSGSPHILKRAKTSGKKAIMRATTTSPLVMTGFRMPLFTYGLSFRPVLLKIENCAIFHR